MFCLGIPPLFQPMMTAKNSSPRTKVNCSGIRYFLPYNCRTSPIHSHQILRLNRPRINRPWFDQPTTNAIAKKGGSSPTAARSNSSSGCSSDPQSGQASPVSSKCSSEGNPSEKVNGAIDGITRLEIGGANMTRPSGMVRIL